MNKRNILSNTRNTLTRTSSSMALILKSAILFYLIIFSKSQINDQDCFRIPGFEGIEDFTPFGKYFLASSNDRLLDIMEHKKYEQTNGKILLIDTHKNIIKEVQIENFPQKVAFHPSGISLLKDKVLYVINHAMNKGGERIEIFNIKGKHENISLTYKVSFVLGENYNNMFNCLAVIDKYKFFLAQTFEKAGSLKEDLRNHKLQEQTTYVYYCNITEFQCKKLHNTEGRMNFGLAYDNKHKRIYVADTLARSIRVYDMKKNRRFRNNEIHLELKKTIELDYFPENLKYDHSSGEVYVGVLNQVQELINFVRKIEEGRRISENFQPTSGVLSINTKKDFSINTLVMQRTFSFISLGYKEKNKVVMGSYFDEGVYICKISS